jgi:predicted nucleic acid-binding protein
MGKNRYLIDTNILIYHFADAVPEEEIEKIKNIFKESFAISIVSKIEFLGWKKHTDEGYRSAEEFIQHAKVININKRIADKTIELRRKHSIKLPDALIAATALTHHLTLITRNDEDFKNMNLKIYNPFRIT